MDNFIRCLCEEDYTALLISGKAPETQLREAWVILLNEYYEINEPTEARPHWKLRAEITRTENHLTLVQMCIDTLAMRYVEGCVECLRKLGYSFKPVEKDPATYVPLLHQVAAKARNKYVLLQQLIKELEEKNKKLEAAGNKKPTRQYYENLLAYIEEMQGTAYDLTVITVTRFTVLEQKYFKMIADLETKKHANG
jgi:hypothetical protein